MKRLVFLIFVLLITFSFCCKLNAQINPSKLIGECVADVGDNTTYLKDYVVKLPKANSYENIPIHNKKTYQSFDFQCQKTGSYQIWISFKDGEEGFAVGILSLVNE